MILRVHPTNAFKRDVKKLVKRGLKIGKLDAILTLLMAQKPLPERCRPHTLVGQYKGRWECHIAPDWLLIYGYEEDLLILGRTGSHADLFDH
jgi:mRNA interferase YafQ